MMDERKEKRRRIFRKCCRIFNAVAVALVLGGWGAMLWFALSLAGSRR